MSRKTNNAGARTPPRAPGKTNGIVANLRLTMQQERAVSMRLTGMSYMQIGNELDIEAHGAWSLVNRAYKKNAGQLGESIEQVREMELGKLDKIETALWGLLQDGGGELVTVETGMSIHGPTDKVVRRRPGIAGVVDRLLAVQQSRRALLGLDAAAKYEHTGKGGGPIALEAISRIVQRGESLRALAEANKPSKDNKASKS